MTFKEKVENFWFYHKTHTIFAFFTVLFIVISISQCSNSTKYDMCLAHVGTRYIATEDIQMELLKIVPDVNGDGEINVYFDSIIIPEKPTSESDLNMIQKLTISFVDGSTRIFIMEKDFFEIETYAEMFKPLNDVVDEKYLENGFKKQDLTIAISTLDCPVLVQNKMANENLFVGILNINPVDEGTKNIDNIYNASETILKEFMNNGI